MRFDDGSMQLIRGWNRVRYIGGLDRWRTCFFGSNPLLRRDHRLLSPAVGAPAVVWNPNSFSRRVGCDARGRLEEVGGGAEIGVRAILENADAAALAARVLRDAVDNVGAGRDHEDGWSPPPPLPPATASLPADDAAPAALLLPPSCGGEARDSHREIQIESGWMMGQTRDNDSAGRGGAGRRSRLRRAAREEGRRRQGTGTEGRQGMAGPAADSFFFQARRRTPCETKEVVRAVGEEGS